MTQRTEDAELVRLEKVAMTFPSPAPGVPDVNVIGGVDLAVRSGQLVLVEGCSGSGKTTLLGLAGLLWRPSSGKVFWMGRDVRLDSQAYRNRLRRSSLGFVFQDYHLFERMPAWESVALPLRIRGWSAARCRRRALSLMARLGLEGRENHSTEQLSGGEKQRVAVARAVAPTPDLVIADEPLSNADPRSADLILSLFEEMRATGAGILVASHDRHFSETADLRVCLDGAGAGDR